MEILLKFLMEVKMVSKEEVVKMIVDRGEREFLCWMIEFLGL